MIGFILDGDLDRTIKNLNRRLGANKEDLHLLDAENLKKSSLLPSQPEIRETRHRLSGRILALHHIFLAS